MKFYKRTFLNETYTHCKYLIKVYNCFAVRVRDFHNNIGTVWCIYICVPRSARDIIVVVKIDIKESEEYTCVVSVAYVKNKYTSKYDKTEKKLKVSVVCFSQQKKNIISFSYNRIKRANEQKQWFSS